MTTIVCFRRKFSDRHESQIAAYIHKVTGETDVYVTNGGPGSQSFVAIDEEDILQSRRKVIFAAAIKARKTIVPYPSGTVSASEVRR